MTREEIELYFERIGLKYDENEPLGIAQLRRLQFAHVTNVPYETTEIVDGHPLSLEESDLFRKIVTEKRGGYCFELNGLFGCLLRSLGYEVDEYMARFLRGEKEIPKPRHRVLDVKADGKRMLCDVGIGSEAPYYPLEITEGVEQDGYRFVRDGFLGLVLEEKVDGEWSRYFSFTENKQINKDFLTPSFYCEKHPSSPFLRNMISLKTPDGRMTIDYNTFRIIKNGKIIDEKVLTDTELESVCTKYFGMNIHRC